MLMLFFSSEAEMRRLFCNWTVFVVGNTFGMAYFIAIPSLHQFVTSTTHPSNPNVSTLLFTRVRVTVLLCLFVC